MRRDVCADSRGVEDPAAAEAGEKVLVATIFTTVGSLDVGGRVGVVGVVVAVGGAVEGGGEADEGFVVVATSCRTSERNLSSLVSWAGGLSEGPGGVQRGSSGFGVVSCPTAVEATI